MPYTNDQLRAIEEQQAALQRFMQQGAPTPEEQSSGLLGDLGNAFVSGVESIPGALVGLADTAAGLVGAEHPYANVANALGSVTGFTPGKWAQERQKQYSPETLQKMQEFQQTDGFFDALGYLAQNPRLAAITAAQSLPTMAAGGVLGRVASAKYGLQPITAGAVGEGGIMAGQQMDTLTQQAGDQSFTNALAALGTGAIGGSIGMLGGRIAQRNGMADVDTLMAGGSGAAANLRQVPRAALQEGVEEVAQTIPETALYNAALGNDLTAQMAQNAALGFATGGMMGAGANIAPVAYNAAVDYVNTPPPISASHEQAVQEALDAVNQAATPSDAGMESAPQTTQASTFKPNPKDLPQYKPLKDAVDVEALTTTLSQLPPVTQQGFAQAPVRTPTGAPVLTVRDGVLTAVTPQTSGRPEDLHAAVAYMPATEKERYSNLAAMEDADVQALFDSIDLDTFSYEPAKQSPLDTIVKSISDSVQSVESPRDMAGLVDEALTSAGIQRDAALRPNELVRALYDRAPELVQEAPAGKIISAYATNQLSPEVSALVENDINGYLDTNAALELHKTLDRLLSNKATPSRAAEPATDTTETTKAAEPTTETTKTAEPAAEDDVITMDQVISSMFTDTLGAVRSDAKVTHIDNAEVLDTAIANATAANNPLVAHILTNIKEDANSGMPVRDAIVQNLTSIPSADAEILGELITARAYTNSDAPLKADRAGMDLGVPQETAMNTVQTDMPEAPEGAVDAAAKFMPQEFAQPQLHTADTVKAADLPVVQHLKSDPLVHNFVAESLENPEALIDKGRAVVVTPSTASRALPRWIDRITAPITEKDVPPRVLQNAVDKTLRVLQVDARLANPSMHLGWALPPKVFITPLMEELTTKGYGKAAAKIEAAVKKQNPGGLIVIHENADKQTTHGVLYHEMMHEAMTPAARKTMMVQLERLARSMPEDSLRYALDNFKNSIPQPYSAVEGMSRPVEELLAYAITHAAEQATKEGMSITQYLNRNAKGLRGFIQKYILPKIQALGLSKNVYNARSKTTFNTFVELARSAAQRQVDTPTPATAQPAEVPEDATPPTPQDEYISADDMYAEETYAGDVHVDISSTVTMAEVDRVLENVPPTKDEVAIAAAAAPVDMTVEQVAKDVLNEDSVATLRKTLKTSARTANKKARPYAAEFARLRKIEDPATFFVEFVKFIADSAMEQGVKPSVFLKSTLPAAVPVMTRSIMARMRNYVKDNHVSIPKMSFDYVAEAIQTEAVSPMLPADYILARVVKSPAAEGSMPDDATTNWTPTKTWMSVVKRAASITLHKIQDALNFTHRLARDAAKYLGDLPQLYLDVMNQAAAENRESLDRLHDLGQRLSTISDDVAVQMNDILTTLQDINEDLGDTEALWPFMPDWLPEDMRSKVRVDPTVETKFLALPHEAQVILKGLLHEQHVATTQHLAALETFKNETLAELVSSGSVQQEEMPLIEAKLHQGLQRLQEQLHKPYVPLGRYGDYVVIMESQDIKRLSSEMTAVRSDIATLRSKLRGLVQQNSDDTATIAHINDLISQKRADLDTLVAQYEELQRDPDKYAFHMADSVVEATRLQEELQQKYAGNSVSMAERSSLRERAPETSGIVELARLHAKGVLGEEDSAVMDAALTMFMLEQHTSSLWSQMKRRKLIAGFDPNLIRSAADSIKARHTAATQLKYAGRAANILREMDNVARNSTPENIEPAQRYTNEFIARHRILSRPVSSTEASVQRFTSGLMGFNAWFSLLMSPMFYVQTMLQNLVATAPLLSEFGMNASLAYLTQAQNDMINARSHTRKSQGLGFVAGLVSGELLVQDSIKDPKERDMLQFLWKHGVLDIGISSDFGEFDAVGERGKFLRTAKRAHYMFTHIARVAEINARGAAALAAFRLKYKNVSAAEVEAFRLSNPDYTNTDAADVKSAIAARYAKHILETAHGNYSSLNAPKVFNAVPGGVGRLLLQFKKFQLIQLYMMADLVKGAFKKATTPEEKAAAIAARKQLLAFATINLPMVGLMGMPAAAVIVHLAALAGGDELPDDDAVKLKLRELFGEHAELALNGLPAYLGVNLSQAVGWGSMLSIAPYNQIDMSKDGYTQMLAAVTGAPGSTVGRLMDAFGLASEGRYLDAAGRGLPAGLRNVAQVIQMHTEGGLRTRNGVMYVREEDVSAISQALYALNMHPTAVEHPRDTFYAVKNLSKSFSTKESELRTLYKIAARRKDRDAMRELRTEFMELQKIKRAWGLKHSSVGTLNQAVRAERMADRRFIDGVPYMPANVRLLRRLMTVE